MSAELYQTIIHLVDGSKIVASLTSYEIWCLAGGEPAVSAVVVKRDGTVHTVNTRHVVQVIHTERNGG